MKRFFYAPAGILAWWLVTNAGSHAFGQQYPFLPVAGAPKAVKTLFEDSRGRLWLGGAELACFDGTHFFFLRDYGFPDTESYDISEDTSGAIWIGAETGVYRFANGRVAEIAKGVAVSVIAATPDVAVAAMGPLGRGYPNNTSLIRMQRAGEKWKIQTVMSLDSPGPLALDSSGMLLYTWPGKGWNEVRLADVVRWRPRTPINVVRHPGKAAGNGPMKVMRDRSGCLWWGSGVGENVYDCGDGAHAAPFVGANLRSNMHEGADGTMVLWGDSLLAVGRPGSFRVATRANGLPGLMDAIPGRDGTVWIGTTEGLYRMASPFRIEYWTIRDGVADVPWSIARSGGRMYAGLDRRIVALSGNRSRWDNVVTFKEGDVAALLGAEDGTLLAGSLSDGTVELESNGKVLARTEQGQTRGGSVRLARTPDGEIWLGGGFLARLRRKGNILKLEDHPLQTQPSRNVLAVKYEEHTRKLWSCYDGGLVARDESGNWKEFTTRDGLLVNGCWSLAPLPNGDIWYAYFRLPAIARIRPVAGGGVAIRQYGVNDGIPEPGGDTLDADQRGWLWRGGDLGIYVADTAGAEAGKWLQLDRSDGLPANGMNSGSVFVDQDASLWWGADNDLAHYLPPADLVTPRFSPQVYVSAFSWDGQAPRLAEAVSRLPRGSKVTAHIGSLQFDRRNALRLRYRILPEQSSWRETRSLDLALGVLSAGSHTLEVQGRVFTGPWSGTASRSFIVPCTIWLTWPLLAAYLMTGGLLSTGGYLLHRRHQAEEAELLPDLTVWRLGALLPEVHELAGTLLDSRFEVGGLLARGGFANVMDGYDRDQQQRCAVKVFRGEVKDQAWIQRRFKQEVAALQKVRHPNVVSIYAHGTAPSGAPYLIMEFVEGKNLREILETGPLPPKRASRFLRQLAGALDAIHALGICHRDLKPENVIIRIDGPAAEANEVAVLIDFSIAIVKDADETLHGLSRAAGSFDYMAPEQAIGYAQPSSDIYSLARLVIEMLTGRQLKDLLPDAAMDLPDRVRQLLRGLHVRLSEASIEMLATALEFDPAKRPHAAGSFAGPLLVDLESDTRFG